MLDTKGERILFGKIFKKAGSYTFKDVCQSRKIDAKESCFKRRYIAALLGFISYCFFNSFRMNISISLISMVNSSTTFSHSNASNLTHVFQGSVSEEEETKFNWDSKVQGYVLAASFLGYFLTVVLGGKTAERFGVKVIVISSIFISSICNLLTPVSAYSHVNFLIGVQFVSGLAQGFVLGAVSVLSANWFPRAERGHLSTFVHSGFAVGILISGSLSGFLCESTSIGGWRSVFYVFGAAGILTAVCFIFYLYDFPRDDPRISSSELEYILSNQENVLNSKRPDVPWRKVLSSVPVYALSFGVVGQLWSWFHFTSVHPKFLDSVLNVSIRRNGVFASVPFLLQIIVTYPASYLSFWLQKNNYLDVNKNRKMWNTIACTGYSSCLALIIISNYDRTVTLVCSIIIVPFFGLGTLGCVIVPNDMSPTFAGTLKSLTTAIGSMNGFIIPLIVGSLMKGEDPTSQWTKFFIICITVEMSSAVVFAVFGSADVQEWNFSNTEPNSKIEDAKKMENVVSESQELADSINHM